MKLLSPFLVTLLAVHCFAEKLPPPDDEVRTKTTAVVKELYGGEWTNAKTPQQKQMLAKKLREKGKESRNAVERFVLLDLAQNVAALSGDVALTFAVIDDLDKEFSLDVTLLKTTAINKLATSAPTPEEHRQLFARVTAVIDEFMVKSEYVAAKPLVEVALVEGKKANDGVALRTANRYKARIDDLVTAYEAIKPSLEILQSKPDHPVANRAVGEFFCFVAARWEKGVSMLALGDDATLKAIALVDLQRPSSSAEKVKLGDQWWAYAEGRVEFKNQIRARAAYWYREALPDLDGLEGDRIEKRLGQIAPTDPAEVVQRYDWRKNSRDWAWSGGRTPSTTRDGFLDTGSGNPGNLKLKRNDIQITAVSVSLLARDRNQAVGVAIGERRYRLHFLSDQINVVDRQTTEGVSPTQPSGKRVPLNEGPVTVEILLPPDGDAVFIVNHVRMVVPAKPASDLEIQVEQGMPVLIGAVAIKGIKK